MANYWGLFSMSNEYATFTRPDGKYRVVVSRRSGLPSLRLGMGSGGDAPGVVRLYDQGGKMLQETKVDMVQLVENVEWEPNNVHIKLVADWALPD